MSKRPIFKIDENKTMGLLSLNPSEPTIYHSYFKKDVWSLQEFAALAVGITPELYKEIASKHTTKVSSGDFDKFKKANGILESLVEELKDETRSIGLDLLKNAFRTSNPKSDP